MAVKVDSTKYFRDDHLATQPKIELNQVLIGHESITSKALSISSNLDFH